MAQPGKSSAKKSKPTYIYSILGTALVLFLLGILGLIVIHAKQLSDYFKESVELQVILRDNVKDEAAIALRDTIGRQPFVKNIEYVTKEQAAETMKKEMNEDFVTLLGYNPLYASIVIKMKAGYVEQDSLKMIETNLQQYNNVREVFYQKKIVNSVIDNMKQIGLVILVLSALMAIVVIVLIDNTIRLAMFSNRFLIKTMQMVGATRWFIVKPFDLRSLLNGAISGILSIAGLIALLYFADKQLPGLSGLRDHFLITVLFIGLIIIGMGISLFSTHRAVMKYLKMKLDDLY
ncbi:cell division transport system permease protein [Chitinophaga skermanii]|uniref:Cell division protein FtsX n=1 Tax=Chitinophaga skermanii TaxID=331697 RepID=A0A327QIJ8_9BACT|nr:permease-like cell division protein FtsX [Chitinophaga skermanii]RAJ04180.1 cell division transport system permease protein [Chitinophaga skermanii]